MTLPSVAGRVFSLSDEHLKNVSVTLVLEVAESDLLVQLQAQSYLLVLYGQYNLIEPQNDSGNETLMGWGQVI